jgi:hypothetical protein
MKNPLYPIFAASLILLAGAASAQTRPGAISFRNLHGNVSVENLSTGTVEPVLADQTFGPGFRFLTEANGHLDLVFSNGVVTRLGPSSNLEIASFSEDTKPGAANPQGGLTLKLHAGEIIGNASEKSGGTFTIETAHGQLLAEQTQFYLSFGSSNWPESTVTRATNLGRRPLTITSNVPDAFVRPGQITAYADFSLDEPIRAKVLSTDETGVILSKGKSFGTIAENQPVRHSLAPFERHEQERLAAIADQILTGGSMPKSSAVVIASGPDASFINLRTGETGALNAGMEVGEGTIIRTLGTGSVSLAFENGSHLLIEPNSSAYIENLSSQPYMGVIHFNDLTHIVIRVEVGQVLANTAEVQFLDTFTIISPLDRHIVPSDSIVSVEFRQVDTTAFQTVSKNQSTSSSNAVHSLVVSSTQLSFMSDTVTFIQYAAEGESFTFQIPSTFTHITESRIIPPDYSFIDRTIAFAAPAGGGLSPAPVPTPQNPGNVPVQSFSNPTDPDPVSP